MYFWMFTRREQVPIRFRWCFYIITNLNSWLKQCFFLVYIEIFFCLNVKNVIMAWFDTQVHFYINEETKFLSNYSEISQ